MFASGTRNCAGHVAAISRTVTRDPSYHAAFSALLHVLTPIFGPFCNCHVPTDASGLWVTAHTVFCCLALRIAQYISEVVKRDS